MSLNETALACLNRNRLLYLNMLEVLRRGSAELLWAGEGGVLLYDRGSGAYMLTARDRATLDGMLPLLPADCDLLVGHDLWYRDELAGRFGLWKEELCVQAAWMAPEPPEAPAFGGGLRLLGEEWAPYVCEHYSKSDIGGLEHIRQAIGAGMLGAFVDGTLAGFAGFHGEGSIGLLEVLPAYRRRGLGEALLRGGGAAGAGAGAVCLWPGAYRQRPLLGPPEKGGHDGRPGTALLAVSQIKSHLGRPEAFNRPF